MTKVFTKPRFDTMFDRAVEPLTLPGELTSGAAPELTVIDRLVRGVGIIGRFAASPAMLGVKVRPTGRPVRVTAHFSIDSMSLDWWEERTPEDVGPRGTSLPRLLLVRSQGKTRGAVQLIRQAVDSGMSTTGVVSFDLQPEELTEEGLFILEVVSIDENRPAWASAAALGTVGVRMDVIEFGEVHGALEAGLVSTGNLPVDPEAPTLTLRGGYFVANPAAGDAPLRWIARAGVVEPLVPSPRAKVAPAAEPTEDRPSPARGIKRRVKRAARWVVPVAAVPAARRAGKRAAAFERRVVRAAKGRMSGRSATPSNGPRKANGGSRVRHNPLADVMFDLVSRKLVLVELVSVEGGPMPGVKLKARPGAEIEIVTDGPLSAPALVRLSIDKTALQEVPGMRGKAVRWELLVRPDA